MIRIDTTKTDMADRQAAEFMLDILELTSKENSTVSDIRFRSRTSQVREMIRLKKEREEFLMTLDELVEITSRLKGLAGVASADQIDKLQGGIRALKSLSVGIEDDEIKNCKDNYYTLITGCDSK
jgi:hypothetical protein